MLAVKNFQTLVKKAKVIVITTHIHPDADGIGSQIALYLALKKLKKNVICVNELPLISRYDYLSPEKCVLSFKEYQESYGQRSIDLFIVVDSHSLSRIGNKTQQLVMNSKNLLFIDHHPCPKELQAIHSIGTEYSATGELVGKLINSLNITIDNAMAQALYTSILVDTSSFRYPSVTKNTHKFVSKLLEAGVVPSEAYKAIYGDKDLDYLRLLGTVLSMAQSTPNGEIAWITLKQNSLEKYRVKDEYTNSFINHLLILDKIKVACSFRQTKDGKVKVSFRSNGSIDVSIIAEGIGGGGHNHSSAATVEGPLNTVIKNIVEKISKMLELLKKS
jgi:bifunctional oligoribonuclease and PAP phosphatase NrnA